MEETCKIILRSLRSFAGQPVGYRKALIENSGVGWGKDLVPRRNEGCEEIKASTPIPEALCLLLRAFESRPMNRRMIPCRPFLILCAVTILNLPRWVSAADNLPEPGPENSGLRLRLIRSSALPVTPGEPKRGCAPRLYSAP